MDSKKGVRLSEALVWLMMLLVGLALGIAIGSQFFTELPDFVTWILIAIALIGTIAVPFVSKKEKENAK